MVHLGGRRKYMYDFDERLEVGKAGEEFLDKELSTWFLIKDVTLDEELKLGIDRRFTRLSDNKELLVEYKTDNQQALTGNFFIELSVHYDSGGEVLGWAKKTVADVILYLVPERAIYVFSGPKMKEHDFSVFREARAYNKGWHSLGALVPEEDMQPFTIKRIPLTCK